MDQFTLDEKDIQTTIRALKTALWSGAWAEHRQDFSWLLYRLEEYNKSRREHEAQTRDHNG